MFQHHNTRTSSFVALQIPHLSHQGLQLLQKSEMVHGLPLLPTSTIMCTDCVQGKQHREPIPKQSHWRATQKLQLIHADICSPITPASNSQKRYFLCFIDDYSRKAWVYFLLEKSEAFHHFKCFKMLVEKESGLAIKCLCTDRGGEFNSAEFNDFCKLNGIKRQLTTAYTPQQNGVAERKNRTMLNLVRSMLSSKGVPKMFWPEAVKWTTYVLNRSPTLAVKGMTPEEAWSGEKPSVEHFRVFGCVGHADIPDAKRTKLEGKSVKCVLLGVSDESKGYKLYDPASRKVLISWDVIFEEEKQWDWNAASKENLQVDSEGGNNEFYEYDHTDANPTEENEIEETDQIGDQLDTTQNVVDEDGRIRHAPRWREDYVSGEGLSEDEDIVHMALVDSAYPICFEDAVKSAKWRQAMEDEITAIEKNHTWKLFELPNGAKKIGVKWIYKSKVNEHGEVDKFKARLMAKGYSQKHGIDYNEVFAPIARMDTIRMVIAIVAQRGWSIYQFDVKSTFLHGTLTEDVYVAQPKGYEKKGSEHMVYKLHKALYGLKQAPRAWFSRIESYFVSEGFQQSQNEQTLFFKWSKEGKILIISVYADDLIYTGNDELMMNHFKKSMQQQFEMTDLGKMRFFLGIEVLQCSNGIYIYQKKYAREILRRFGMEESNSVNNPIVPRNNLCKDERGVKIDETHFKQMVGSLMYITTTRPDLMFVVS